MKDAHGIGYLDGLSWNEYRDGILELCNKATGHEDGDYVITIKGGYMLIEWHSVERE